MRRASDEKDRSSKRDLLFSLLLSGPKTSDAGSGPLSGLIQSWKYSVSLEHDSLCSIIPALLVSLFKCISDSIQFRSWGHTLCRLILQEEQLKLLERNLHASKGKDFLIVPALQLLTQVALFDGGSFSKSIFNRRHLTFYRLSEFLCVRAHASGEDQRRRTSIREAAESYLLVSIKLQIRQCKDYLLCNPHIVHRLLQNVGSDPNWMVMNILNALKQNVLEDNDLPRFVKEQVFNQRTLDSLATLYDKTEDSQMSSDTNLRNAVHDLLMTLCTSSRWGLMLSPTSLNVSQNSEAAEDTSTGRIRQDPRSGCITFLRHCRPHADTLQADLVIGSFKANPGLSYEYFDGKAEFSMEPKLTMTWLGYARFILACIQVPVNESLLDALKVQADAPQRIVHEILPQPCTLKVLTHCLNSTYSLISFIMISILNAAFAKFQTVLQYLKAGQVCEQVRTEFAKHCPDMRHLVQQFRSSDKNGPLYREALVGLLASYYCFIPDTALEIDFDISRAVADALAATSRDNRDETRKSLLLPELDHLLEIALYSPHMRWGYKQGKSEQTSVTLFANAYCKTQPASKSLRSLHFCNHALRSLVPSKMIVNVCAQPLQLKTTYWSPRMLQ